MDKKEGYGEFYWYFVFDFCKNYRPDGRQYKGHWKNGKQDGKGIFVAPDGAEKEGIWKEGSKIEWS